MTSLKLALIAVIITLATVAVQFNEDCTYYEAGFPQVSYECALIP
jgi:hypothetical protein